jgi:hypothetical protein
LAQRKIRDTCVTKCLITAYLFYLVQQSPVGQGLLIHEVSRSNSRRTTVVRTPLDEWSARRRDLYLTTHNTHRQTSMSPVGFKLTILAGEWPQTYALDSADTGTGNKGLIVFQTSFCW